MVRDCVQTQILNLPIITDNGDNHPIRLEGSAHVVELVCTG